MDYQLEATKFVCANVGPRNKKRFLNPLMYDMPITEENGRVTKSAYRTALTFIWPLMYCALALRKFLENY